MLSSSTIEIVQGLEHFIVENAKSARAFLGALGLPVRELSIKVVDEEQDPLAPMRAKRSLGLLSEAGCPAIADPGAKIVEAAHNEGFRVVPLVGPSSIVLALMASGLEGQRFAFCGYLPREDTERKKRIRELQARSRKEAETQIFIETPYRNDVLLAALLECCQAQTRLSVAADLTLETEAIKTLSIAQWRAAKPAIGRRPAVFLIQAAA